MEIKDLAGISEPLTRLIEVISQGVGAVSSSYLIRRNADAKAYEIRVITAALREASEQNNLPVTYNRGEIEVWQKPDDNALILEPSSVDERSNLRLDYQERKQQSNLENVTSIAASELANEDSVPDERPNEEWVTRFFGSAQDVSSEQMQNLWGRILAGEIRKPGSYSLRTLEFIRNLEQEEAGLITKLGSIAFKVFYDNESSDFIDVHDKKWLEENYGIDYRHLFRLGELDILYPTELSIRTFSTTSTNEMLFGFGLKTLYVKRYNISDPINLGAWKFTKLGQELLSLVHHSNDNEVLCNLGEFFIEKGGKSFIAEPLAPPSQGKQQCKILGEIVLSDNGETSEQRED